MTQPSSSRASLLGFASRLGAVALLGIAASAWASGTRQLLIDDAATFSAGELNGTAVLSSGALVPGVGKRRIALDATPIAKAMVRAQNGDVFIGTGNDGKVMRLRGDVISPFAQTGQLMVSALAIGGDGTLYAGTLPNGKIFAIGQSGETRELPQLSGAQHVWALRFDPTRKTLFAATGPEGKLFAIDQNGRADVFYDADNANHVMDVALDGQGGVYAALSDEALLLHVTAPGRAEVIYDFPGTELTAIALQGHELAVAANTFPKTGASATPTPAPSTGTAPTATPAPTATATSRAAGKGQLWRVSTTGQARKLLDSNDGHITAVQWADADAVFAALGHDGRVLRVKRDGTHAVWLDVDERQVLAIDLVGNDPLLLTGDTGAAYRVLGASASERTWTSKVLDAAFRSRWGELTWRGDGAISLQTRSGNTEKPDATWSDWSAPLTAPGPVRSPAARFVQVRCKLGPGERAVVHAITAHYLPDNQNASVRDVQARSARPIRKPSDTTPPATADQSSTQYKLSWDVDNPDEDPLRYRVSFRAESQSTWRAIQRESDILTAKELSWDTSSVPDGYYRIRVEASDEQANPETSVQRGSGESEPFLVDNHAPQVLGLKLANNVLEGRAVDTMGPISKLEYAIDGQPWVLFFPSDDLLDTASEAFRLTLTNVPAGPHIIAVRATDSAGNVGSSELSTR